MYLDDTVIVGCNFQSTMLDVDGTKVGFHNKQIGKSTWIFFHSILMAMSSEYLDVFIVGNR